MTTEATIREALAQVEARVKNLTDALHRVEGERDELLLELTDMEGCHDQRFAGVR